jgi:predicted nucleotidyltransferase
MTEERLRGLLSEVKIGLKQIYGSRLRGLYLYGSYARKEQDDESDVDVLIVLDDIRLYGAEIERTGELASRLSLEYGATVSRVFVSEQDWRALDNPFLGDVREEAIPA